MNNNFQNNSPINSCRNNIYFPDQDNSNNLYRSNSLAKKENKKRNFKSIKNNTISSLYDVECFLNKLQRNLRYIKLYKLLK